MLIVRGPLIWDLRKKVVVVWLQIGHHLMILFKTAVMMRLGLMEVVEDL